MILETVTARFQFHIVCQIARGIDHGVRVLQKTRVPRRAQSSATRNGEEGINSRRARESHFTTQPKPKTDATPALSFDQNRT